MTTIYDVDAGKLIDLASAELKKIIKMPEWAKFVKTSHGKERHPVDSDWWFFRAASILRKLYLHGKPIGVNKLKIKYSCKKNRGMKPEKRAKGSGKIIRVILQDLEKLGFVKQVEIKKHKGRQITGKGKSFLDQLCSVDKQKALQPTKKGEK